MAEVNINDGTKKKSGAQFLAKLFFKFYFAMDVVSEVLQLNKSLQTCDKLTNGLKGHLIKGSKNPFKIQIQKNYLVVLFLVTLPIVVFSLLALNIYKNPLLLNYFQIVFDRAIESMDGGFFIKYVFGIDLPGFYLWRFWGVILLILLFVQVTIRNMVLNKHEILKRTKELRTCSIKGGFLSEESKRQVLWTPAGVLIDLEKSDEEQFKLSTEVWLQMSMFAGDVEISQESRTLIFVHSGQRLEESYAYFANGVD